MGAGGFQCAPERMEQRQTGTVFASSACFSWRIGNIAFHKAIPQPLGLQDKFADLARRAASPARPGNVMGVRENMGSPIWDRNGKAGPAHHRDVNEIITHETGFMFLEACFGQYLLIGFHLDLYSQMHPGNTQAFGAMFYSSAGTPGNQRHLDARSLEQLDPVPVLNIELLDLRAVREIDDPAVSKYSVNIEDHEPDRLDPFFELWFYIFHEAFPL